VGAHKSFAASGVELSRRLLGNFQEIEPFSSGIRMKRCLRAALLSPLPYDGPIHFSGRGNSAFVAIGRGR
jgi:hypothetical protein